MAAARGATPPLVIVTHNTWLIPFGAPWMLGRAGRLIDHQCAVVQRLRDEAPEDPLVIVALQELWAFRAGPLWPLLWLMGVLQSALLSLRQSALQSLCCCLCGSVRAGQRSARTSRLLGL